MVHTLMFISKLCLQQINYVVPIYNRVQVHGKQAVHSLRFLKEVFCVKKLQ